MKKTIILAIFALVMTTAAQAQKFAFLDSEYILKNIPSYDAAQDELDRFSTQWEAEVKAEYEAIEEMYKSYKAERVLLSEEMRKKREEDIINRETQVKELQQKYFGAEGELFKKTLVKITFYSYL